MVATNVTHDGPDAGSSENAGKLVRIQKELGFAGFNGGADDTFTVFKLPAKSVVSDMVLEISTAEGSAATISVGTSAEPELWFSTQDINGVLTRISTAGSVAFPAATSVIVTTNTASTDVAIIKLTAWLKPY